jgi:hypothetical protein
MGRTVAGPFSLAVRSLFVWLVADGWFVLREVLLAGCWFVVREKYRWLVGRGMQGMTS